MRRSTRPGQGALSATRHVSDRSTARRSPNVRVPSPLEARPRARRRAALTALVRLTTGRATGMLRSRSRSRARTRAAPGRARDRHAAGRTCEHRLPADLLSGSQMSSTEPPRRRVRSRRRLTPRGPITHDKPPLDDQVRIHQQAIPRRGRAEAGCSPVPIRTSRPSAGRRREPRPQTCGQHPHSKH